MKPYVTVLILSLACPSLPAQMNVPTIGTVRYPDGSFHTVHGLPSNMIVADLPLDAAQAASFSDRGGLVLQSGMIRLLAADFSVVGEIPAQGEKPLLAVDGDLTSALAWLPNSHTLLHWDGTKFEVLSVAESDVDGTVSDIQSSGAKKARLIVLHSDNTVSGVTISLRTGNLVSSEPLPGAHGYTFGQGIFVVYANDKELVADNLDGYRRTVPLPAPDFIIERMSNTWLHFYSPSLQQNWALHLTQAEWEVSMLPGLPDERRLPSVASNAGARVK